MRLLKTTPIFFVDAIEPRLGYWRDRLGYQLTAEVTHGDHLGFVILERDGFEVMLQTWASAEVDSAAVAAQVRETGSVAFIHEEGDLDDAIARFKDANLLAGPRRTDYGMREIFVQDEEGYVHGYAARA